MLFFYSALLTLAAVMALPVIFLRSLRDPDLRRHLGERLGATPISPLESPSPIWFHAVSVGEVRVALRLFEKLREASPELPLVLTSTTPAGRRLATESLSGAARASFFPLDLSFTMRRALRRTRPRALVLTETEIWPNLLRESSRAGIPVILANGRISQRSFPRYRRIRSLIAPALETLEIVCMQSEEDAERIRSLGARRESIRVVGNVKWDLPAPEEPSAVIRRELGLPEDAPVFVAGSTAEGEDAVVLEAWSRLSEDLPGLQLVLAPRHPQRFDRVARLMEQRRIPFRRRSAGAAASAVPVLLLDTVGELRKVYAAGTACFVGGSLVSRGGQNLMEPAAAGRPVLFGPRTENFEEAARLLLESGAGSRVADAESLSAALRPLLSDPRRSDSLGAKGRDLVLRNRGAASRTAGIILEILRAGRGDGTTG